MICKHFIEPLLKNVKRPGAIKTDNCVRKGKYEGKKEQRKRRNSTEESTVNLQVTKRQKRYKRLVDINKEE